MVTQIKIGKTYLSNKDSKRPINSTVQSPKGKSNCDQPAYLFWKMQSRLIKLANRLRTEQKLQSQEQ